MNKASSRVRTAPRLLDRALDGKSCREWIAFWRLTEGIALGVTIVWEIVHSLLEQRPLNFSVKVLRAHRDELSCEGLWGLALERFFQIGDGLPTDLKDEYLRAAAFPLRCLGELRPIEERCRAEGIPLLVFKGCALAFSVYARPVQRSFGDVDLAIPRSHRLRFEEILRELGCWLPRPGDPNSDGLVICRDLSLDVHEHPLQQLAEVLPGIPNNWWEEGLPLHPAVPGVMRLPTKWEFLLALFHGAKHAFARANWVVDIAVLARTNDPELAVVVRQYRAGRHLWLAQECLRVWYGVELPESLQAEIRPPGPWELWSRWLCHRILERRAPDFLGMLTPLWVMRGWGSRLKYLWPRVFPKGKNPWQRLRHFWNRLSQA